MLVYVDGYGSGVEAAGEAGILVTRKTCAAGTMAVAVVEYFDVGNTVSVDIVDSPSIGNGGTQTRDGDIKIKLNTHTKINLYTVCILAWFENAQEIFRTIFNFLKHRKICIFRLHAQKRGGG